MKSKASGFTLLELLITIVILVILVTVAAPSFVDTLERRRIINATQAMADQLQMARSVAVVRNQPVSMVINRASGTDWCFGLSDAMDTTCDCSITNPEMATACTIVIVEPSGAEERILAQVESDRFPGVTLAALPNNGERITFEPTRGIRIDAAGPSPAYLFESNRRGIQTRINVNLIGRISTCSPSGTALLGGTPPC